LFEVLLIDEIKLLDFFLDRKHQLADDMVHVFDVVELLMVQIRMMHLQLALCIFDGLDDLLSGLYQFFIEMATVAFYAAKELADILYFEIHRAFN
jgi:hypothetical protein